MKEKKYFLFILCMLMLFTFYLSNCLAAGTQSLVSRSTSGGVMESSASSGGNSGETAGFVARKGGVTREFRWVKENRSAPADKSARGALDGSSNDNKGNIFTTTVLSDIIKVGQQADNGKGAVAVYKDFLSFDTSGIDPNATDISMDLVLYLKRKVVDNEGNDFYIEVLKSVYEEPLWNSDWGATKGGPQEATRTPVSEIISYLPDPSSYSPTAPDVGKYVIHIRDAYSLINWGGTIKLALVSSQTFAGVDPVGNEYVEIYSPNARKELRPTLQISYTGDTPKVKPALSWLTGDTYYKDTGAQPDQVYEGTTKVTFCVRYFSASADDGLGVAPTSADLLIDLNGDGNYSTGEVVPMTAVDGDTDFSDGKDYQAVVNVVSSGTDIKYQFRFRNGTTEAGGTPATVQLLNAIQTSKDSKSDSNLCFISSIRW